MRNDCSPAATELRRAKADVRRLVVAEMGIDRRLMSGARFSKRSGAERYADLNIGTTSVILTILGTGSAACRQVPVSVSCVPARQQKVSRPKNWFRRSRWRSLSDLSAAELHKRTFNSGGQNG